MTEKVDLDNWLFKDKLRSIVDKNVKEIPWEGQEIDKDGIVEDIIALLKSKEYSLLHHTKNTDKW